MNPLIVVTGGTKGIGKAIIHRFAQAGFDIVTCARNEADLLHLREELLKQFPETKCYVATVDMSKKEEVKSFGELVNSLPQAVEVLINNAGRFIPGFIHEEEEGVLEEMIETNLYSTYHLCRSIVPEMKERKAGHVFNICSTASITAYTNGGSYAISKHAQLGLTRVLREEMKEHGVKVTAIMPGATLTASWDGVDLPEERFMKAEDVAESVWSAYQMSPSAVVEEIVIRPQLGDLG
ncbi:SDR family oxidoreductase [Persicobacter psychrovividus]|uniref:Short-chain dehydrogenase n=1 Tax=Persicobacter psychrovividus TaxID=387638 RepID=A0ABM7VFV5_9BACT|nr:short-chain dehydrogenase [Persicobacter psychrovividus]